VDQEGVEPRLRLQHFIVQPVLVWDDGNDLTPGPQVQPQPLTVAGLRELAEEWPAKLAELQAQAKNGVAEPGFG
jgi:hypothetical protein